MKKAMNKMKYLFVLPALMFIISLYGCKNNSSEPEEPIDESAVLLKYLEDNGDYINTQAPSTITAEEVRNAQINAGTNQIIVDLRNPEDFVKGHIEGAVNKGLNTLYDYVSSVNAGRIVLVCYGGQTSSYATGLLRLNGFNNVFSMQWGMSAWDTSFAANGGWLKRTGNSKKQYFTNVPYEKVLKDTTLPVLHTGQRNAGSILSARVKQLLNEGFVPARITCDELFKDLSKFYLISYCPEVYYFDPGHIQNAVNYKPQIDFRSDTNLKKLPLDKKIILYCFTGEGTGYITAFLRILGYDAQFVIYGSSGMIYSDLKAKNLPLFTKDEIKNYPFVKGN